MENTQPVSLHRRIPFWRRISWTLIMSAVLVTTLPVLVVGGFILLRTSQATIDQTVDQLTSVAVLKEDTINRWLETSRLFIEGVLANSAIFDVLAGMDKLENMDPTVQANMNTVLKNSVALSSATTLFNELFIYGPSGMIVASSDNRQVSKVVTLQPYYESSLQGEYVQAPYYEVGSGQLTMLITRPLLTRSGRVAGVLAGRLNLDTLSAIMTERSGLGESGETYLISRDNSYLITPSRFSAIQQQAYTSEGIKQALNGQDGSGVYDDYRGLSVVGVYRWMPKLNAALMAEIDTNQALLSYQQVSGVSIAVAMGAAFTAAAIALYNAARVSRPIIALTQSAARIAQGDFSQRANIREQNEVGLLADTFNSMTAQLQDSITGLEERVQARTRDLETAAEIASAANQVRELDDLLSLTVNLIRDRFNFYYVQIYLLDSSGQWAVLKDGTGYVGRKLLARGHRLPVAGNSIVAEVIRTQKPYVVQDTAQDPRFLPNDLLPETRAEIAIPLMAKDQLIGVLDIQHDQINAFEPNEQQLFQTLADQLAVTFENVNLFESVQKRAVELETVAQVSAEAASTLDTNKLLNAVVDLTKKSFGLYHAHIYLLDEAGENLVLAAGAGDIGREMVKKGHSIPLNREHSLVARAARTRQGVISNDVTQEPDFLPNPLLPETKSEMAIPIIASDKLLGVLDVQAAVTNRFTDDDVRVKSTLAGQVAIAIQNARAYEQSARRAQELALVAQVGTQVTSNLNLEALVRDVAQLTAQAFDLYHIHVFLADASGQYLKLVAGTGHVGCKHIDRGYVISISEVDNLVTRAAATRQSIIDNDVIHNPEFAQDPNLPDTRSHVAIPMLVGETLIGVLEAHSDRVNYFTEETVQIKATLVAQIAVAAQNARSYEQNLKRAVELETVAQVSAEAASTLDTNKLLNAVVDLTKKSFGLYHAHIYLLDEAGENLVLAAGAGDIGREMVKKGHNIPLNREHSLVARAARTRQGVISNDVTQEPDFLPNPLLPETKSEMAIPIIASDKLLGVLDVQAAAANRFTDDDVRVKSTLAGQVAIAIQNARAYERMQTISAQLSDALHTARLGYWEFDFASGNFIFTDEFYALIGTTVEAEGGYEMPAQVYAKRFVHPDEQHVVENEIAKAIASNDPNYSTEFISRSVRASGEIAYDLVKFRVEKDTNGKPIRMIGANQDVTERVRAQEEITRQNAILVNSRDFISMADPQGNVTYINPGGLQMIGIAPEDVTGLRIPDVHTPEDAQLILEKGLPVALETGQWRGENRLLTRDGRLIPVDQTIFPVRDDQGNLLFVATIMTDITERKAAEELIRKRAAELETVAKVSAAAATILAVQELLDTVTELTKTSFGLYHAHVYLLNEETENLALAAGAGDIGKQMVAKGHSIPLNHEHSLVARAARTRQGVISNDVTQEPDFLPNPLLPETRAEMALPMIVGSNLIGVLDVQSDQMGRFTEEDVRVMTTLASQVAVAVRNAMAFEREHSVAERLREIDRLKSEFIANMSHELRTPLNSIIGYSEVLLDGVDGDLSDDAIEDIRAIHGSGQHLLTIINDILDLAKIEAGQMRIDLQPVDLGAFIKDIVHAGHILVKDKPVELRVEAEDDLPHIEADPVRLRQIVWNIMSNAVKFTEQGSVTIRYGRSSDNPSQAVVSITDTGIGIKKELLPVVFERFRQVDGSSTRRAGGTGLGLAITRHLVQLHGGSIYVESEEGQGSTFWFTLPLYVEETVRG